MGVRETIKIMESMLTDPATSKSEEEFEAACSRNWAFGIIANAIMEDPFKAELIANTFAIRFGKLATNFENPEKRIIFSIAEDTANWISETLETVTRNLQTIL